MVIRSFLLSFPFWKSLEGNSTENFSSSIYIFLPNIKLLLRCERTRSSKHYQLFARLLFLKFPPNIPGGENLSSLRLLNYSFSPKESLWSLQDGGYLIFLISSSHRSSEVETSWKGRVEEDKSQNSTDHLTMSDKILK